MRDRIPAEGSVIWIRQRRWRVERARREHGVVRLDVRDRRGRVTFLAPFDRPAPLDTRSMRRVRPQGAAARLAGTIAAAATMRSLPVVADARVEILAYQLEPALALAAGVRRVLLADEIGLGKTVQAGIAIADAQRRHGAQRVLVICPAVLRDQWMDELRLRFGLSCLAADRQALEEIGRSAPFGTTAWKRRGVWVTSVDFLKQPHVLDGIPAAAWDLVVIDEAHEAAGATDRHAACDELARRARQVLLLTATPHSGDSACFARLRAIGELADEADEIVTFRRTRDDVRATTPRRIRWHRVGLSPEGAEMLDALAAFERFVLAGAGPERTDAAVLLLSVFRKRALSTAAALARSLERRLEWLSSPHRFMLDWIQPRLDFEEEEDDVTEEDRTGLMAELGLEASRERLWLRRLQRLAVRASRHDRKIARVVALLERRAEPVVVFTEFRDSLDVLRKAIERVRSVAVLHGGQTPDLARDELARFRNGRASVLLATDVAGRGINLQDRSRWVIDVELPWNPVRLEQRIGRVDRLGQRRPVHATILIARHAAEGSLLFALARRTLAARQALGADVLPDLAPAAESAVARTLLGVAPSETAAPSSPQVRLCTTWRRRGRAAARLLDRRRRIGRLWRGDHGVTRPSLCRWRRGAGTLRRSTVAVVVVPFVDATGTTVDRHLLVLGSPAVWRRPAETSRSEWWADIALLAARRTIEARRRRIARWTAVSAGRMAVVERAVGRHLYAQQYPERVQPELFSADRARAFEQARRDADALAATIDRQIATWQRRTEIEIGRPVLALLFLPRR